MNYLIIMLMIMLIKKHTPLLILSAQHCFFSNIILDDQTLFLHPRYHISDGLRSTKLSDHKPTSDGKQFNCERVTGAGKILQVTFIYYSGAYFLGLRKEWICNKRPITICPIVTC